MLRHFLSKPDPEAAADLREAEVAVGAINAGLQSAFWTQYARPWIDDYNRRMQELLRQPDVMNNPVALAGLFAGEQALREFVTFLEATLAESEELIQEFASEESSARAG